MWKLFQKKSAYLVKSKSNWIKWGSIALLLILIIGVTIWSGLHIKIMVPRIVKQFHNKNGTAFQYNTPTIVDDFIYIGTSNWINYSEPNKTEPSKKQNYIYKLDLDFKKIWQYDLPNKEICAGGVTLDSLGNLYFVTQEYIIDLSKTDSKDKNAFIGVKNSLNSLTPQGELRWKKTISDDGETWIHGMYNVAISQDDKIYVADSKLFSFDVNGNMLWQFPQDSNAITANLSAPIIDQQENVYFISPEGNTFNQETSNIYAYKFSSNSNGNPTWQVQLHNNVVTGSSGYGGYIERWMLSTPAFSHGEKRLVIAVGNTINSLDTENGEILWSYFPENITGSFKASPAIDSNNNIYIGTKDNTSSILYAIKADGSGILWKSDVNADMYCSPIIGDDYVLYIGSEGSKTGVFHEIDLATGRSLWGIPSSLLLDSSYGSYALHNGYIYFGTHKQNFAGSLFKIKVSAQNYQENSWPRFHGTNSNTGRSK